MSPKAIRIIAIILAVFVVLSFAKNTIAKISVEQGVHLVTGLKMGIRGFNIGLLRTNVDIKGIRLYNPRGFKDKLMMDMPEVYVDYDLPAIIKGTIHIPEMRLDMKEFVVVKNADGALNLDSLNVVQQEKTGEKEGEMPKMQIDSLQLKIGKVVYKDYSAGGKPSVQEFNININETYKNIDDPNKLVSLIVVKALMNTTIAKLTNFDIGPLKNLSADTLATAQKMVGQVGGQLLQGATPAAQEAGKAVSETADSIGGAIGGLFGSKEKK